VGKVEGRGAEELDARGKLVTPGFIDIHAHYDGQATWKSRMAPSSNHHDRGHGQLRRRLRALQAPGSRHPDLADGGCVLPVPGQALRHDGYSRASIPCSASAMGARITA
jgi:hypothetical protein